MAMLILVGLGLVTWVAAGLYLYAHQPASAQSEPKPFSLASGEGFDHLTQRLHDEGLIRKPRPHSKSWMSWSAGKSSCTW
ncbi:MAG: hypothetical protein P8X55_11400 [Desulfosarcinaceae bacterium]